MRHLYTLVVLFFFGFNHLAAAGPVAICYAYVTLSVPEDACEITVIPDFIDAGSYDPDGDPIYRFISGNNTFGLGTHTVTLGVTDWGTTNTCFTQITVVDHITPTVTCTDRTYTVADPSTVVVDIDDVFTADDNCGVLYRVFDTNDGTGFRTDPYTAWAYDAAGNGASCSGTITIADGEPQSYCTVNPNSYYEHISRVRVNGLGCAIDRSSGDDGGYHYQPATGPVTLYWGYNYTMLYNPGFRSTNYHEHWRVYLDANRDGDFSDAGELLHSWYGYGGNSVNLSIPTGAWGWTRLRVVMSYGVPRSGCEFYYDGEVEEYSVFIAPRLIIWPFGTLEGNNDLLAKDENYAPFQVLNRPVEDPLPGELRQRSLGETVTTEISEVPTKLYPNPVNNGGLLTVETSTNITRLRLTNLLGQILEEYPLNIAFSGQEKRMENISLPSQLAAGIYLVSGFNEHGQRQWSKRIRVD